jgi:hypothetical protein
MAVVRVHTAGEALTRREVHGSRASAAHTAGEALTRRRWRHRQETLPQQAGTRGRCQTRVQTLETDP